jgi:hypothetical protein
MIDQTKLYKSQNLQDTYYHDPEAGITLYHGDAEHIPLADQSVDFIFTSPPYLSARHYGDKSLHSRQCQQWIDWMMSVVTECTRVCRGLVLVNCAGVSTERIYQPGPEGLLYEWWKRGGVCWRPAYWHRVGIPGSGGKHWLRADIEYVLCFKGNSEWPSWSDNTANGHPPKWGPGGEMSYRQSNGSRRNACGQSPGHVLTNRTTNGSRAGKQSTRRRDDGERDDVIYLPPVLANPGNLVQGIPTGGGMLGSKLAHENEAPFPVKLCQWFIRSWCPPGGTVLDPFMGSGSCLQAAIEIGRKGIGIDIRENQCELAKRRLSSSQRPLTGITENVL